MRPNVVFAQPVIRDATLYKKQKAPIIEQIEARLEENPLRGIECVRGVNAIRVMNFLPELPTYMPYIPTLSCHYVYLPLPDFSPLFEADELFVFRIGRPYASMRTPIELSPAIAKLWPKTPINPSQEEVKKYTAEIISIYNTVDNTV